MVDFKSMHQLDTLPSKWVPVVIDYLKGFRNDTTDFNRAQLRSSVQTTYPAFVCGYSALIMAGTLCNAYVLAIVIRKRLYAADPVYVYVANLALTGIVECVSVLPISLMVLLIQNWAFGRFMCYFLPMLQDVPIHVMMLTFLVMAFDRFKHLKHPNKMRLSPLACTFGCWIVAFCIVLPYPVYTDYLNLGDYIKVHFEGVGICVVNMADDMQDYLRSLFILTYLIPLIAMGYLYTKMSEILRDLMNVPPVFFTHEITPRCSGNTANLSEIQSPNSDSDDVEIDGYKESKTQKYLISMVVAYTVCLCPLMILRLAKLEVAETYENSRHFDLTFMICVWLAFVPMVTTPLMFVAWNSDNSTKDRIRSYFKRTKVTAEQSTRTVSMEGLAARNSIYTVQESNP
ncbi:G protein-coupled receptor, rhodopsin-like,GPCR, rhodopsin-like, 7TM [Cinara cedri]|uniref:G protein-coupled receptor, rhodopsin-like,GPCR, rhodopsin-like, 7TM n=1 Tax=Cinara cedri TaxID=506608 RepID=A0A5E4NQX5_9HEMI|nr:G protein-coupled receptor, rhodopsin-like,GPCR, rhodopsin-like, 7TM [Cinara cedri]